MSDIYKLQYNGMTLAYPGWNGYVGYESAPAFRTLTLCASNGGTLTADTITGMPGDTVTLSPIYDTYWRLSGYDVTGGTIDDNTFTFSDEDATVYAAFKPNAFTATGTFGLASTVTASGGKTGSTNTVTANGILKAFTGDKPSDWPATNDTWNVANASAYNATARFSYAVTGGVSSTCTATMYMNGVQQSNNTYTAAARTKITAGTTASNKTQQGTMKASFTLHGYNNGAYYTHTTATLYTQGFTATGYAP